MTYKQLCEPACVIGQLGEPLGRTQIIEGYYLPGDALGTKGAAKHYLKTNAALNELEPGLVVTKDWKEKCLLRLVGYETGSYTGQTEGDMLYDQITAVPRFHFHNRFNVLGELKFDVNAHPEIEPDDWPYPGSKYYKGDK